MELSLSQSFHFASNVKKTKGQLNSVTKRNFTAVLRPLILTLGNNKVVFYSLCSAGFMLSFPQIFSIYLYLFNVIPIGKEFDLHMIVICMFHKGLFGESILIQDCMF